MTAGEGDQAGASYAAEEPPDAALARRVQDGDRYAFELLARRYLRPIHTVVAAFLDERADIEDAAQETLLRVLDRIHTFDPKRPFRPWLYQIARNMARNRRKSQRRRRTEPLDEVAWSLPADEPDPSVGLERARLRRLLGAAIDQLPEQQRVAFRLAEIEGYAGTEIAELMGVSAGTVRSHVHHARRALRDRLAPILEEGDAHEE